MTSDNSSNTLTIEFWFIPSDIIMVLPTSSTVLLGLSFLIIIIVDKTCHTVSMMLVANTIASVMVFALDLFGQGLFALRNDLYQIQAGDSLCILRGYILYTGAFLLEFSFTLQAVYRYIKVLYPTRLSWVSLRFQILLICLTWILGFLFPLPHLLDHKLQYLPDNQICQMPSEFTIVAVYNILGAYLIPNSITMFVYYKLVRYTNEMNKHVTLANTLQRAQNQLKMVRRILILISIVVILALPYVAFFFMSFITTPPQYHLRIGYTFVDPSLLVLMIVLFQFTDPLKASIMKKFNGRRINIVLPINA